MTTARNDRILDTQGLEDQLFTVVWDVQLLDAGSPPRLPFASRKPKAEIAILVASGHAPRTVAAFTRRRPTTVRGHLERIYRKLRVSRQVELARLVLSLEGLASKEP